MKKVAVLLSTYNGEKYIEEQIKSIFNQDYDTENYNLALYIRDDGSKDSTRDIIQNLSQQHNLKLDVSGDNLGFAKSFYTLLSNAEADYYFFADQDDIWLPNKLSLFLKRFSLLESKGESKIGVFSDALIATELGKSTKIKLLNTRQSRIFQDELTVENQLFEHYVQGASLAFNNEIAKLLLKLPFYDFPIDEAHDHFIGLVVSCVGTMSFVNKPTLLYRQSGNNVYGARKSDNKNILDKFKVIHSRVNDVQSLLLYGELILSITGIGRNRQLFNQLETVNSGTHKYDAIKFFLKYKKYISYKNPIIVAILYGILFTPNKEIHSEIIEFKGKFGLNNENNMGITTKL